MTRSMNVSEPKVLAVIPARFGSTRFPGKPLAPILGRPMILWTLQAVRQCRRVHRVMVATDDPRIREVVESDGGEVLLTDSNIKSGTDRVAVAAEQSDEGIIVNLQGDEPLIDPSHIDIAITALISDREAQVSTLASPVRTLDELWSENVVKVLLNRSHHAITFSRAPIPFPGFKNHPCCSGLQNPLQETDPSGLVSATPHQQPEFCCSSENVNLTNEIPGQCYLRHIGIYVFRRSFLKQYTALPVCWAEQVERLEQMRILDQGEKIKVAIVDQPSIGVDIPEDLITVEKHLIENLRTSRFIQGSQ